MSLTAALIAEMTSEDKRALAEELAPYLPRTEAQPVGFLSTRQAAEYLGMTPRVLQQISAADLPYSQNGPGGKRWYRVEDLDAYRS